MIQCGYIGISYGLYKESHMNLLHIQVAPVNCVQSKNVVTAILFIGAASSVI